MNIPNILTLIRFFLIPVFGYYMYTEQYSTAVGLFILSGFTDVLDGYIARKFNMITSFGKLADPLADKLTQITALALLTMQGLILPPVIIVVIAKEIFMGLGSILIYRKQNVVVSANWYGKMATVIFHVAIISTIVIQSIGLKNEIVDLVVQISVIVAVLATLFAFFMYSIAYRKIRSSGRC